MAWFYPTDDDGTWFLILAFLYAYIVILLPTLVHTLHKAYTTSKSTSCSLLELKLLTLKVLVAKINALGHFETG